MLSSFLLFVKHFSWHSRFPLKICRNATAASRRRRLCVYPAFCYLATSLETSAHGLIRHLCVRAGNTDMLRAAFAICVKDTVDGFAANGQLRVCFSCGIFTAAFPSLIEVAATGLIVRVGMSPFYQDFSPAAAIIRIVNTGIYTTI